MGGKTKSWLRLSTVLLLSLSVVLGGCGSGNGNNAATPEKKDSAEQTTPGTDGNKVEPFEVSVFIGEAGQQPTPDNKIYKKIKDELGASFNFEFLAGDINQKLGVMIAGSDYPDMMTGNTKLTAAGAYIPLEDLIEEHAPNLKKHYEDYWNMMKDPNDGHIYILPNYGVFNGKLNSSWYSGPAFWIQKAVLEEFGYPKVKTLDEYFDLIGKYKEKYPTIDGSPTIGFEILNYDWRNWGLFNAPQHLIGHPNDGGVVVKDGVAEVFANKDYAKQYYQKLNEMNAQGLIDKETFVQNYDQYLAKLSSGTVLGMFDQHWNFQNAENSLITQGKDERTYVGLPLVYDENTKDHYRDRAPLNLNNGFGISVNAKDPVKILKMLDALITEDWQKVLSWGIEGEDYIVNEEGRFMKTQEQRDAFTDGTWKLANKADAFFGFAPKIEGSFSDGNATDAAAQPEEYKAGLKEYDKKFLEAYGFDSYVDFFSEPPENEVAYPAWTIDLVEGSEAKVVNTKLNDLSTKFLPKAILAKPADFESAWSEYTAEIGKINIKAYEDRINEQIQWRITNWSK
ncbi:sugar ABC transporter substrate-binding protein [Paenibacillus glucanolyticus]|jgi:putative aldouronate transport system substrate-binding protein|uniref:Sugar ABC transporter substrate-binding protein n=1 Tax=Paenibacillus glucanolyticus TaxID=59843 RepID=A0A162EKH9_9BACL|nr:MULTISPECIES: ABC transporter substrate-binding protein [Paenibacillus]ANA80943.1 sugar ABC transporter substrate-binding protein [Paenibacillus glucanolyticus]AVV54984.1 sugar ABC transporter substrate-binding protein [Paenibacillus glucanolyticus]ETT40659.1 family 1 extracellular solute-binding protein [Paenibacillus sp. FSL R5-808]KZS46961.1 sugar ABC transporter substrate-binding protein [Paenibacillus glucanolyticus]MDH6673380.1 putative aldouronate transport system substrate-binding p